MYERTRPIDNARCNRSRSAKDVSDEVDASDAWNANSALSAMASAVAMSVATALTTHDKVGIMREPRVPAGAATVLGAATCRSVRVPHLPDDRNRVREGHRARRGARARRERVRPALWRSRSR